MEAEAAAAVLAGGEDLAALCFLGLLGRPFSFSPFLPPCKSPWEPQQLRGEGGWQAIACLGTVSSTACSFWQAMEGQVLSWSVAVSGHMCSPPANEDTTRAQGCMCLEQIQKVQVCKLIKDL